MKILWDVFNDFDLSMNLEKTQTLIYNWKLGHVPSKPRIPYQIYPTSIISINGININNVTSFKYLGAYSQIDDTSVGNYEVENRLTAGTCKFFELLSFFTNRKIYLKTRLKFLESLVRSRMTYMCQSQCYTKVQLNRLDSEYCRFLRFMIKGGHQRLPAEKYLRKNGTEGEYTRYKMSNEKIWKIAKCNRVSQFIKNQQINWIGHCVRSKDTNMIKMLTFQDFPKDLKKKTGILQTTYRQTLQFHKIEKFTEKEMITQMKNKKRSIS